MRLLTRRFFSLTLLVIVGLSGPVNDTLAQQALKKRDALQDSIAWMPQQIPVPGVVAGTALWFDYNDDGRLDILFAGESADGPVSGIYENTDSGFVKAQTNIVPVISENGLAWGDYDNDGNLDFAIEGRLDTIGAHLTTKVYKYHTGNFVDADANLMGLTGGTVTWVDYDNDGHLDLLISGSPDQGSSFNTILYRNIRGQFYEEQVGLPGVWGSSIAWADYDNDGFVDLVITGYGWGGTQTTLYHNAMSRGVIGFDPVSSPIAGGGQFAQVNSGGVAWFDCDNDGYQDLIVTGTGYGNTPVAEVYRNNGDGTFTNIQANLTPVSVSAVAVGDYDNDGFLDVAVSGGDDFSTGANPKTKIYHNNGNLTFTDIGANLTGTWFGSLSWGDYDKDGRLDLLVTGATLLRDHPTFGNDLGPVTILYKNVAAVDSNTTPSTPTDSTVTVDSDGVQLRWGASTDKETGQKGITYNVRVGTTPGGFDIVSPLSNTSSGFRRLPKEGAQGAKTGTTLRDLPPGTYYWSVQAVDHQLAGSPFSPEKSFVVTTTGSHKQTAQPSGFVLEQNYPNPFNPTTGIRYQMSGTSWVRLAVFDLLGREVTVLVDERQTSGEYEVRFDGSNLSSGVYFYRLAAGSYTAVRKMTLIK